MEATAFYKVLWKHRGKRLKPHDRNQIFLSFRVACCGLKCNKTRSVWPGKVKWTDIRWLQYIFSTCKHLGDTQCLCLMGKDKMFLFAASRIPLLIILSRLITLCWHLQMHWLINVHLNSHKFILITGILHFKETSAAKLKWYM